MSEDRSQMANTLESNDTTSNLPPPGGGFMAPSSSDDDTANGNGPISINKGTGHTLNTHAFSSERMSNEDDTSRPSTSSSIAVGGARPKVRSFQTPRNHVSTSKETSSGNNPPHPIVNGYLRSQVNSEDLYDDPPSYEAAMAMANGTGVTTKLSNEMNSCRVPNLNFRITNGQSNIKHTFIRNSREIDPIPNGNGMEHTDDTDELSESVINDENNESDTDDDELNEDEELTADLPKSFYILDVGSDSEGGNCSNQGVSRAGQSNLSSEVAKLLIQSEMVAQQRLQNGLNGQRVAGSNSNSRRSTQRPVDSTHRRRVSRNDARNHQSSMNGDVPYMGENDLNERLHVNQNGNVTPDDEADFLEMDFEPNDSDDSDDSGDSGRGADETTDGNDAAEDLDEFVQDHGFGAAPNVLGGNSSVPSLAPQGCLNPVELAGASASNNVMDFNQGNNNHSTMNNIEVQQRIRKEAENTKALELPLAVKTNLNGVDHSKSTTKSPQDNNSPQQGREISSDTSAITHTFPKTRRDSGENTSVSNELSN